MPDIQAKPTTRRSRAARLLIRLVLLLLTAALAGALIRGSSVSARNSTNNTGFALGMYHGAVMPCTVLQLALGQELTIYAVANNGRLYNLGYAVGVNACGALFFGIVFYRFSQWRRRSASGLKG